MLPNYTVPHLNAAQAGAFVAGTTHDVKREPREMLDLFFMDPHFNPDTDAVLRVRSFWPGEDCAQLRSRTDTPDLVIFGTIKPVPALFDGKFYWVEVLNPETLVYEGHFCGDRQIISNFVRSSHLTAVLRYEGSSLEDSFSISTREHAFQGLKTATEKTEDSLNALLKVAAAAKPAQAKFATSGKNLTLTTKRWIDTSEEALERVVFADLMSPAFYQLLVNMKAFAKTRGILEENMFIHEANDDVNYGWGVAESKSDASLPIMEYITLTVPLLSKSAYGGYGRHSFKGKDIFGRILTNASRIMGDQHYLEFMRDAKEQGMEFPIVYKVDATREEVMKHVDECKIKLQAEAAAKKAADKEAAAKKAADDEATAKKVLEDIDARHAAAVGGAAASAKKTLEDIDARHAAASEASMEVDDDSQKRPCTGLGSRTLSYIK